MTRLDHLRAEWLRSRERLHLMPLRTGTVSEYAATLRHVLTERPIDVAMLAMAVSDFEPDPFPGKIDSQSDAQGFLIHAHYTPKVIRSVRDWAPEVFLVGFKLLSRADPAELIAAADEAGRVNRADLTVANDLRTVRDGQHTVHLIRSGAPLRRSRRETTSRRGWWTAFSHWPARGARQASRATDLFTGSPICPLSRRTTRRTFPTRNRRRTASISLNSTACGFSRSF